ncbi:sigma-70 family RNA polymerase sigma factor [Haliangium sp.]|uniref:sigma-70 family RNA polymerase sigma factor n=1 Tax=Haliangium sp. TaxID=2663208 RepID=UPI003D0B7F40
MLFSIVQSTPPPPPAPPEAAATLRDRDVDLVQAMAAGDSEVALTRFYERFAGMVMAILLRMLGSRAEAEELLQEVFLELWRRTEQYDPRRASVATWVATIARSRALDALRARQRRGGGRHMPVEDVSMQAPAETRPDNQTASSLRSAAVHRALAQLSEPQREVLELSYFEGLSHREIAARLDQPVGTVKSRVLAAMKILRVALAPTREGRLS